MRAIVDAMDRALYRVESILIVAFMACGLTLGVLQVVLRYGFNTGIHWAETVFVMVTAAGMMIAGSRAVRSDSHVRMEILFELVSPEWRRRLDIGGIVISLTLCAYYAVCGWLYVVFMRMIQSISPSTGLPEWIYFTLVPVTFALFSLRYLIRLYLALTGAPPPKTLQQIADAGAVQ